jgi:hypothetical protein
MMMFVRIPSGPPFITRKALVIDKGFSYGAPGRAHSLGGESPLRTLVTETVS